MKILHITPSYKPAFIYGGTTVSVSQLCENLSQDNENQVTVITTTANGQQELPIANKTPINVNGVSVYYFRRITKDHTHFSPTLLWFLFKNVKSFDVVHIHSWWNLVAVFAVLVCWLRGVKPILAPRGMLSKYSFEHENSLKKQLIHHSLGKFLLSKTFIHATASAELTEGKQLVSQWQGFVLPNILPLPKTPIIHEQDSNSSPIKLLFLSRIDKKKGLELLFEALSKVSFLFHLDIIGTGDSVYINELQQLATDYHIDKNITWLGRIEGEKRFEYYAQADIFLLLSQNENFANVVIEALSQGTAVFISDNVGLADYVMQKQLGEITKLEVNEIVEKLQDFTKNQTLRKKIRDTAPTIIAQDFDKANIVKQYLYEYEKVRLANL